MGTFVSWLMLGLFTAFIELRLALVSRFLRELFAKSAVLGIAFSIALSLGIGALFGAAGVTVMIIAVVCMTITQPVYMILSKLSKAGKEVSDVVQDIKNAFAPFATLFRVAFKLIALPFIILSAVAKFIARIVERFESRQLVKQPA